MKTPILLVAHQPLASALADVVKHVLGDVQDNLYTLDVAPDADKEIMQQDGRALIQDLNKHQGSLVISDCFGSTPSNIGQAIAASLPDCYFVAGANVPMLLRVLNYSDRDAKSIADIALEGGKAAIMSPKSE